MTFLCWNRYQALALIVSVALLAAFGAGSALAGDANAMAYDEGGPALILADASGPGGGFKISPWPVSLAGEQVRPPADKENPGHTTDLTSAAIIRPLKDKNFALALIAAAPVREKSSPAYAGQTLFKRKPLSVMALSRDETIQWVVLTAGEGLGRRAAKVGREADLQDDTSWHYSVEMIYLPIASLAVRAALSLDPGEEEFDTHELSRAFEPSKIGISIGLDFRPRDGVLLDIGYARVMNQGEALALSGAAATSDAEADERRSAGDDVVTISLSIQF